MIRLGKTARYLRDSYGLSQRDAADKLGISVVHLCNIENDKAQPSPALLERFRELWGVDLYVLAWCVHGDVKKLPKAVQEPIEELAKAWENQLSSVLGKHRKGGASCSISDS